MPRHTHCPTCDHRLTIRDDAAGSFSCPVCLASLPRERAEAAELPPSPGRCPRCGRDVERLWMSCPFCHEPLPGRGAPDLEVRRDRNATNVLVVVLAVLGAIGIGLAAWYGVVLAAPDQRTQNAVTLTVGLLFLIGIAAFFTLVFSGGRPGALGVRRVFLNTLAAAGGAVVLMALLGGCLFFFIFTVCSGCRN